MQYDKSRSQGWLCSRDREWFKTFIYTVATNASVSTWVGSIKLLISTKFTYKDVENHVNRHTIYGFLISLLSAINVNQQLIYRVYRSHRTKGLIIIADSALTILLIICMYINTMIQSRLYHILSLNWFYCILCGQIKGFNSSITTVMCEVGSYSTVVG